MKHSSAASKADAGTWSLRPADETDVTWMVELRAEVMRQDLERVGVYDPVRVRQRFLDGFVPANTQVIVVGGRDVGLIAVRTEVDARWVEHFYLDPAHQGQGIGAQVLAHVMDEVGYELPFRLDVLRGSAARRLYERQGFRFESADGVDEFLVRHPSGR